MGSVVEQRGESNTGHAHADADARRSSPRRMQHWSEAEPVGRPQAQRQRRASIPPEPLSPFLHHVGARMGERIPGECGGRGRAALFSLSTNTARVQRRPLAAIMSQPQAAPPSQSQLWIISKAGGLIYQSPPPSSASAAFRAVSSNEALILAGTLHGIHAITARLDPTTALKPPGAARGAMESLESEGFAMSVKGTATGEHEWPR